VPVDTSPERRAARQVAMYAQDAEECRAFLEALGLLEYLTDSDGLSSQSPSMLTTPVHIPFYKIVGPNTKHA
jgi:hypothetical protein